MSVVLVNKHVVILWVHVDVEPLRGYTNAYAILDITEMVCYLMGAKVRYFTKYFTYISQLQNIHLNTMNSNCLQLVLKTPTSNWLHQEEWNLAFLAQIFICFRLMEVFLCRNVFVKLAMSV